MSDFPQQEFDFDAWSTLARSDPEAFEAAREEAVRSLIDGMPAASRRRLTGLQWRIDMERARAANPTASFLRLSEMMWDSFYRQREHLNSLLERHRDSTAARTGGGCASIIPLRRVN
ncbi:MAG TPA: DUF3135 domain-containing protein [Gammaproteobacteria bacterium]|nr:DUF3135 domain-containing protein [Gammaproteobacteria bacterium]